MKRSPFVSSHRHADSPPKPGKREVSTNPLRYSSAPKRFRCGSRGSKVAIGRALTSIATRAVTENSSGAARFGGGCVASCARAEPGSAIAESPAAVNFRTRRREMSGDIETCFLNLAPRVQSHLSHRERSDRLGDAKHRPERSG